MNDSILFFLKENNHIKKCHGKICGNDAFGNSTLIFDGELPYKCKLSPTFAYYSIFKDDTLKNKYYLNSSNSLLECYASRWGDSISFSVHNPRNIPFNYNIYKRNKQISGNNTTALNWRQKCDPAKHYYAFSSIHLGWKNKYKYV